MSLNWLASLILVFSVAQVSQCEILDCPVPNQFYVYLKDGLRVNFSNASLYLSVDPEAIEFHSYTHTNGVHIKSEAIIIGFSGRMKNEMNTALDVQSEFEKFSENLNERISGYAKRVRFNETAYTVYDCRLILLPHGNEITGTSDKITNAIRRLSESCIENVIYTRFNHVNRWNFIEDKQNSSCLLPAATNVLSNLIDTNVFPAPTTIDSFQSIINKLVDIALAEVIAQLKKGDDGMIDIPDIEENFSTGSGIIKTNGQFSAFNGKFGDLTTIKRTADAVLSKKGYKYRATGAFGIFSAKLNYPKYKLKYGIIRVNGLIDANIDGVQLEAAVSLDYTKSPCIAKVEEMKVIEFGNIKIEVSGLGPANAIVSNLLGWIGQKWKQDIIELLENKLTNTIQEQLSELDCEKFRP